MMPRPKQGAVWAAPLIPALTVVIGLQLLRAFVPAVVYVGFASKASLFLTLFVAVEVFLAIFVLPTVVRWFGFDRMYVLSLVGILVARLGIQFIQQPGIRLFFNVVGVIAFFWYIPLSIRLPHKNTHRPELPLIVLLGITIDSAFLGMWGTLDMAWQTDAVAIVTAVILVVVVGINAYQNRPSIVDNFIPIQRATGAVVSIWMMILMHQMLWSNIAYQSALLEWELPSTYLLVMIGSALGLLVAAVLTGTNFTRSNAWWVLGFGIVTLGIGTLLSDRAYAINLPLAHVGMAILFVLALQPQIEPSEANIENPKLGTAWGWGGWLFFMLISCYFSLLFVTVTINRSIVFYVAAMVLIVIAVRGVRPIEQGERQINWKPVWIGIVLCLIPLFGFMTWTTPEAQRGDGYPVRIMSYNIHQGYSTEGNLDLDGILQNIEASHADIVNLQEVSRGWILNGGIDTLDWLSRQLDMPYIYSPTVDAGFGNAILSRFPIMDHGYELLPSGGIPLLRSLIWAEIDVGDGEAVFVINTHLHHVRDDEGQRIRLEQIPAIIDQWDGREFTVIVGDFNAPPEDEEHTLMREAGLIDSFIVSEPHDELGDGATFPARNPVDRIDLIYLSEPLTASDFEIFESLASDHFGVAVTIAR